MKSFVAAAVLALPLCVSGITITSPVPGIVWNSTGERTVSWVNQPNDPSEFAMYLINFGTNQTIPPQTILINAQVTTSADSYTFDTALPAGTAQLEFTAATNITDVLAESGQFSIAIGGRQGCSTCTGIASSTTPPSGTATSVPATKTGSPSTLPASVTSAPTTSGADKTFGVSVFALFGAVLALVM